MGHARAARRSGGREGAPHPRQGGHRGVRRRAVRQEVHRVGLPLHERVGGPDRARRVLGGSARRVRHLPPLVRGERVVGARRALQEGPALPGTQGRLVVGAGRHGAQLRRGGAGVQDRRRPERVRGVSRSSVEDNVALLVWTTTPWTLPSNMYAAVNAGLDYVVAQASDGRRYVVAKGSSKRLARSWVAGWSSSSEMKGRDLVGAAYRPPFDLFAADASGFEDVDLARHRRRLRHARRRHRHRPRRSRVRRRRPRAHRRISRERAGVAALLRREARRHVHRPFRGLRGAVGQGLRQGHLARPEGQRACSSTRSSTVTTIRSAGAPTATR